MKKLTNNQWIAAQLTLRIALPVALIVATHVIMKKLDKTPLED